MSFDKLLGDLEELQKLQKSAPADEGGPAAGSDEDDEKISAAAEEGATEEGAADEADTDDDSESSEGEEEAPLGKSFRFQLDSGEEVEAVDGTELVKSLMARFDSQESTVAKALGAAVDLIKSQGAALASLQNEVKRLGSEGRGRKTVVSVAEKPAPATMEKSEPAGLSGDEFMAKALVAQAAGRITGLQVSIAEGSLLKGLAVPADIVKRVLV